MPRNEKRDSEHAILGHGSVASESVATGVFSCSLPCMCQGVKLGSIEGESPMPNILFWRSSFDDAACRRDDRTPGTWGLDPRCSHPAGGETPEAPRNGRCWLRMLTETQRVLHISWRGGPSSGVSTPAGCEGVAGSGLSTFFRRRRASSRGVCVRGGLSLCCDATSFWQSC